MCAFLSRNFPSRRPFIIAKPLNLLNDGTQLEYIFSILSQLLLLAAFFHGFLDYFDNFSLLMYQSEYLKIMFAYIFHSKWNHKSDRERKARDGKRGRSRGNVVSGSINHLFCLLLRILNVPCLWCHSSAVKWKSTRSYEHPRQVYVPQHRRVKKERSGDSQNKTITSH